MNYEKYEYCEIMWNFNVHNYIFIETHHTCSFTYHLWPQRQSWIEARRPATSKIFTICHLKKKNADLWNRGQLQHFHLSWWNGEREANLRQVGHIIIPSWACWVWGSLTHPGDRGKMNLDMGERSGFEMWIGEPEIGRWLPKPWD